MKKVKFTCIQFPKIRISYYVHIYRFNFLLPGGQSGTDRSYEIKLEINNKKIIFKCTHLENLKNTSLYKLIWKEQGIQLK